MLLNNLFRRHVRYWSMLIVNTGGISKTVHMLRMACSYQQITFNVGREAIFAKYLTIRLD